MWRALLKGLFAHKRRLARTAVAVALGVGFVAGTFILTDMMDRSIQKIFDEGTADIDVVVRAKAVFRSRGHNTWDREAVPATLLERIRGVQGVERASGSVQGYAQMVDKQGKAIQPMGPPAVGAAWGPDDRTSAGRAPERDGEVAIDATTAGRHDFRTGDGIKILFQGPARSFTIVGIRAPETLGGATLATFDISTAQRLFQREGRYDSIAVRVASGSTIDQVRDRLTPLLPSNVEAVTITTLRGEAQQGWRIMLGFLQKALLIFAAIALFVGGFLIFNTFSILVVQRTRELGLLRAVGASRTQVMMSVAGEAVAVGLAASLGGVAIGAGFALGILKMMEAVGADLPSTSVQILPRTVLVSLATGLAVTLLAALGPARRATEVPPVVAITGGSFEQPRALRRRVAAGATLALVGLAAISLQILAGVGSPLLSVGAGAGAMFIGIAMLSALAVRPVARGLSAPLVAAFGLPAALGRENAARAPRRTAATAATLMIGLGLVGLVTILAASFKASASKIIADTLRADLVLQPKGVAEMGAGVSPALAARIKDLPGVAAVSEVRTGQWGLRDRIEVLAAVDPASVVLTTTFDRGTQEAIARLSDGVLVRTRVASSNGWRAGDPLPMQFAMTGLRMLRIQGTFEWTGGNWDYLISLDTYEANYSQNLDSSVAVLAAPGASVTSVRTAVEGAAAGYPNVSVLDQAGYKRSQTEQIDRLLALVSGLLALSIVIALLGITNTLSLSIHERTRELGLLRAVGAERSQVRAMIRWEALVMTVFGAALGLVVSVFFGWALVRALADQGVTEFVIPAGRLGVYALIAAVAGLIAATSPARRAARLNVLEAIATE